MPTASPALASQLEKAADLLYAAAYAQTSGDEVRFYDAILEVTLAIKEAQATCSAMVLEERRRSLGCHRA